MQEISFLSDGLQIFGNLYETARPGDCATIFCHGAFDFKENWSPFAERLSSEGITTLTFDFAGHGSSEGIHSLVNLRTWAHNIRDTLNELGRRGYRRFALVGWGSGGSAALLAAAHDHRLACLVVLSAPVFLQPPLPERLAYGLVSIAAIAKKGLWKKPLTLSRLNELENLRLVSDRETNTRYVTGQRLRENYRAVPVLESLDSVWMDITRALERVNIPVRIIHGTEDEVVPVDQSNMLYGLLKGEKDLQWVEGCGHALHLDREKEAVYRMISGWVEKWL